MSVLTIRNLESHHQDTLLFPSFSLEIAQAQVTAIYSSLNVRHVLLDMFIGKTLTGNGSIQVNGITPKNKSAYYREIGILFFNDGLYDRLTVNDHLKFYKKINESDLPLEEVLALIHLKPHQYTKANRLTFSEKQRLHFAGLLFKNPSLYILEEPDLNVDTETRRVLSNLIAKLQIDGKSVIILTGNMESAITVADTVYRLDDQGLHAIDMGTEDTEEKVELENNQTIHFDKIPTKVNDKIILFDPPEIDYIESHEGQSNIHVKGEAFPCVFTLSDLEERLKAFGFFRCHRSYIVNLQKVREVITWTRNSFNLILDDDKKSSIPLSKAKMAQLKDMLGLK